jgi:glucokinase
MKALSVGDIYFGDKMRIDVVADIGGTNARFAVVRNGELRNVKTLPVHAFEGVVAALQAYLASEKPGYAVSRFCLAVAGPVQDQKAMLTNAQWAFDSEAIRRELQADAVHLLNDWEAVAWSLTGPNSVDVAYLHGGPSDVPRFGTEVLIGPGTGLGVAHLSVTAEGWQVISGEGGHVTWAPKGHRQLNLANLLYQRMDHVSFERIASGQGLVGLYETVCQLDNLSQQNLNPAAIVAMGLSNQDGACREALEIFHHALGVLAGNLALVCNATRVCLAGGVVERLGTDFIFDQFWDGFSEKGRLSHRLQKTPVARITSEQPGLEGCIAWLSQARVHEVLT